MTNRQAITCGRLQHAGRIFLAMAWIALSGCRPGTETATASPLPLQVVVAADTGGWIVPCGCTSNQSGGMPYRGAFLNKFSESGAVVLLDAGGAAGGDSPYDREKFEAILKGEIAMGITAHNIGRAEAALGQDYLAAIVKQLNLPLISTNLCDQQGNPVFERLRIVTAAQRRLAVVGVIGQQFADSAWTVLPPRQAILAALATAAGQYDTAIVLAYLPEDELLALAAELPEVDLVVGGPTGQSIAPRRQGPTLVASATNKGKFIVRFQSSNTGWEGEVVEVTGAQGEDDRQQQVIADFYEQLADRDFSPRDTSFVDRLPESLPDEYRVAGTHQCQKCHEDDCSAWDDSPHAHAWSTLQTNNAHVDSYCQQCHTTGYGSPGGFLSVNRSSHRVDVGCESCHGPSQQHAVDPEARTAHFGRAATHCSKCHDRENSPEFTYADYWPEIEHGNKQERHTAPITPTNPGEGSDTQ